MQSTRTVTRVIRALMAAALLTMLSGQAWALDVYLRTGAFDKTMADGRVVTMWGYATDSAQGANDGVLKSPGDTIVMLGNDSTLNIHLTNNLTVETSVMIPGMAAQGATPVRKDIGGKMRIYSFDTPVAAGGTGTYTFTVNRPGTFMYASGTNPSVQVQMGLLGGMYKNPTTTGVYPGINYDAQLMLVLSEVDPELHDAVANGTYGDAETPTALEYNPEYFLVNGESYSTRNTPASATPTYPGADRKLLLRMVNAGYRDHAMSLAGEYLTVVGENAYPLRVPRQNLAVHVAPQQTAEALFTLPIAAKKYFLYDRRLSLTDGSMTGPGGMALAIDVYQTTRTCKGDVNQDGWKNSDDMIYFASSPEFGRYDCAPGDACRYDFNGDGSVNLKDLSWLRMNLGQCSAQAAQLGIKEQAIDLPENEPALKPVVSAPVSEYDLELFKQEFGRDDCAAGGGCESDLNGDGVVDRKDLLILLGSK